MACSARRERAAARLDGPEPFGSNSFLDVPLGKLDGALDLLRFLRYRKRYWLVPFLLVLVAFGLILVAAESSVIGPFIYTLF